MKKQKSNLLTKTKRQPAKLTQIKAFLRIADLDTVNAIKKVSRKRLPRTVEIFDRLADSEIETIRRGQLRALPADRLEQITEALRADKFEM